MDMGVDVDVDMNMDRDADTIFGFSSNQYKPKLDLFRFGFGLFREIKKITFVSVFSEPFRIETNESKQKIGVLKQTDTKD
jgi:hypothetical protein